MGWEARTHPHTRKVYCLKAGSLDLALPVTACCQLLKPPVAIPVELGSMYPLTRSNCSTTMMEVGAGVEVGVGRRAMDAEGAVLRAVCRFQGTTSGPRSLLGRSLNATATVVPVALTLALGVVLARCQGWGSVLGMGSPRALELQVQILGLASIMRCHPLN